MTDPVYGCCGCCDELAGTGGCCCGKFCAGGPANIGPAAAAAAAAAGGCCAVPLLYICQSQR